MKTKTKVSESKKSNPRFETLSLTFTVNDHILVVRDFSIIGYNGKFEHSMNVKNALDSVMSVDNGIVPNFLKKLSVDDLWSKYDSNELYINTLNYKSTNKDVLKLRLTRKVKTKGLVDELLGEMDLNLNLFQLSVKSNMDIRPILPEVIETFKDEINAYQTTEYGTINLKKK